MPAFPLDFGHDACSPARLEMAATVGAVQKDFETTAKKNELWLSTGLAGPALTNLVAKHCDEDWRMLAQEEGTDLTIHPTHDSIVWDT